MQRFRLLSSGWAEGLSNCSSVCLEFLTPTQGSTPPPLQSWWSLERPSLVLASEKLGMESRPATYWPSDLGQVTAPPHLEVRAAHATLGVAGELRHLSKHHTHPWSVAVSLLEAQLIRDSDKEPEPDWTRFLLPQPSV